MRAKSAGRHIGRNLWNALPSGKAEAMSKQEIGVKRNLAPRPDWAFGLALACVVGMVFLSLRANRIDRRTAAIVATQAAALRIADNLRQSSDDLTRMARSHAATGDERYLEYFREILDIRNGSAPRPREYHLPYWDLVIPDGERSRPAGKRVAMRSLIEGLATPGEAEVGGMEYSAIGRRLAVRRFDTRITESEIALLVASEDASNSLAKLEEQAFEAVRVGNRDLALELLHSREYHEGKARIMAPLAEFAETVQARMREETVELAGKKRTVRRATTALVVLSILFMGAGLSVLSSRKKGKETPR